MAGSLTVRCAAASRSRQRAKREYSDMLHRVVATATVGNSHVHSYVNIQLLCGTVLQASNQRELTCVEGGTSQTWTGQQSRDPSIERRCEVVAHTWASSLCNTSVVQKAWSASTCSFTFPTCLSATIDHALGRPTEFYRRSREAISRTSSMPDVTTAAMAKKRECML